MNLTIVFLTAGVALAASCSIIPVLLRLSHRFHWYDDTNHRKIHSGNIPRIGGVGIFLAFLLGFAAWRVYAAVTGMPFHSSGHLWPLLAGGIIIHLTGLYDDFRNIRAQYKFFLQVLAACIVVFTGHTVDAVYLPFFDTELVLGPAGYALAIVWIVGLSNAVNLIDGMDGLSGGISASVSIGLGVLFLSQGYILSAALTFSLLGGILGFLLFNKPPARLFMGDSGSLTLGFLLASLPLVESTDSNSMAFPLAVTLLLIPILDTLTAILRRAIRRKPVHSPDKEHLHHKLMALGLKVPAVLGVIYTFSFLLTAAVMFWVFSPGRASSWCLFISWVLTFGLFFVLHFLCKKRRAEEQPS